MPKLIVFESEHYYLKQTGLRYQLRADTRTGKKLCWDTKVVGYELYRSQQRMFANGGRAQILMWFTGSDAELVMFKLASNIEGVKIIEAKDVNDDAFKSLNLQLEYSMAQIKEAKREMNYCRWNYAKYRAHQVVYQKHCRRLFHLYQEILQQYPLDAKWIEEGTP